MCRRPSYSAGARRLSASWGRVWYCRFEHSALRQDARLDKPPQRDQKLPREGYNAELPIARIAMPKPRLVPLGQRTARLEPQPAPRNFHRHGPYRAIACFGDAQFVADLPTLMGCRRQTRQGPNLFPILKAPPSKKLHHKEPGTGEPNAPQAHQLAHLLEHGVLARAQQLPPVGLQRIDLLREEAYLLPVALQPGAQGRRQRGAIPLPQLGQLSGHVALQREAHPLVAQQAVHAIGHPRSVPFGSLELSVELPAVFFIHARYAYHTPHLLLAGAVAQEHRQELADIEPVGLRPALAPIDLNTGGIDDVVLDAMRDQGAVEPEAIAASLVTAHDACVLRQAKALLRPCDLLL